MHHSIIYKVMNWIFKLFFCTSCALFIFFNPSSAKAELRPPTNVSVGGTGSSNSSMRVSWSWVRPYTNYRIYRSNYPTATFKLLVRKTNINNSAESFHIDTCLHPNTEYCYKVQTCDSSNTCSALSPTYCETTLDRPLDDSCSDDIPILTPIISLLFFSTDNTFEFETVTSAGQVWMDRNLGASRVATSSTDTQAYGDLYQWGRGSDGHEKRTSGIRSTLSFSDTPGHGDFITADPGLGDWRTPQNDNLWQGVSGTNNPCPAGFRLPTVTELDTERLTWSSNYAAGAFGSPLKLVVAGYRYLYNGTFNYAGSTGHYWSSTVSGSYSRDLYFGSGNSAEVGSYYRAGGFSVRCLKD